MGHAEEGMRLGALHGAPAWAWVPIRKVIRSVGRILWPLIWNWALPVTR